MIIVTNGKDKGNAVMLFGINLTFGNWFSKMIKSKNLMVSMGRAKVGY